MDDLLSFCRMARQPLRLLELDMGELARDAYNECVPHADRHNINFILKPLPKTCGDPAMLHQVMVNLIGSAIKFTGPREFAEIEIGGHQDGDSNIFCIRDDGVGFDMRYVEKLFKVFQRLHTEAEFEGTGVGLGIAHRVIHRHGGRIWAEGKVNVGATCYFTLPRNKEFV